MTLEGNDGSVSHLADNGRLDLTLVKIDGIPSPDPYGYLQLQTKGTGPEKRDVLRWVALVR